MNALKTTPTGTTARVAAAMEEARQRLGLETLDDRHRDALDFHSVSVASIRDVVAAAFEAGRAAATGAPAPYRYDPADPGAMLDTLEVAKQSVRKAGGTWVTGTIGGHRFEALVFGTHADDPAFELDDSRISKLSIREGVTDTEVANFDRGWGTKPTTDAARAIVDLLASGLAELVFGT